MLENNKNRNTVLRKSLCKRIFSCWQLYIFLIPGLLYLIIFKYKPMYGILIAFKNYSVLRGFDKSPFCGFENFVKLWTTYGFTDALRNTVQISFGHITHSFPAGVILAVLINEIRCKFYKKTIQTAVALPHFVSWVVVAGLCYSMFSPNIGAFTEFLSFFGVNPKAVNLLQNVDTFQQYLVWVNVWKAVGWNSIIYLAAIAGIDPQLYEAAKIDGAGRLRQIWHVTLPGIQTTIVVTLILRMGIILEAGFDEVYVMTNPIVNNVADIIDTFVYRIGLQQAKYHLGAAADLFKSVIAMIMVFGVNFIARRVDPDSSLF